LRGALPPRRELRTRSGTRRIDFFRLAANADDGCLEIHITARQFAVDRLQGRALEMSFGSSRRLNHSSGCCDNLSVLTEAVRVEGEEAGVVPAEDEQEGDMNQYLLSTYQPDGPPPPSVDFDTVVRDVDALEQEMKAAGVWVFNSHLYAPGTAVVVRDKDGDVLVTDGPYAEGKEHLGGLSIIKVPDLDAALTWAGKMARATTLPIEVRLFHAETED
jgi:hypothetical protein